MVNALKTKKELLLELEKARKGLSEVEQLRKALRLSDERFSVFFINNPLEISIVRLRDNVIIDVNDTYIRHSGYKREEIIGCKASEMDIWVNPEERERVFKILKERGRISGEELRFRGKTGEEHPVTLSAERINYGNEDCLLMMTADIYRRKQAEEELKESEDFTSRLLINTPNAIFVTYPDGTIKYVNPAFEKLTGFSSAEITGRGKPYPWWPEDKKDEIEANLEETAPGEGINLGDINTKQMSFQKKSGELFIVELNATVINKNGQRQYIVVSWVDITEREKAEQALKDSEEKFSKAFSTSANAICITSLANNKFIEINEAYTSFTGYTREEVIGHTAAELRLWVYPEELKEVVRKILKDGKFSNIEFHSRKKSGEIRVGLGSAEVINIGGAPCRIVVITDITERKKAEDALKMSEENFRHSLDDSPLGIRIVNSMGEPIYINQALLEIYGYNTLEEYQSRPIEKRFTPEMYQEHLKVLQKLANQEVVPKSGETSIVRKDGEIRILAVLTKEILWNGERQYQLLYIDITERKQAEEKLKKAMANLEQSSARLAAANKELEAFSYSVSHDLRSPLRSIDGFSQALLEDYAGQLDDTGKDYLQRLRNASRKMGELIDGLLRLSRLSRSELHRETMDIGVMAVEIMTRLRETQPERKVEFIIGKDLTANVDPQLCRALLENLLGNAWKFTGKTPQAVIEFGSAQRDEQKTFFVKDNGAGFDMTYVDKLFGAFQRLHDNTDFPGTGIGLATVRRIVNRHGGNVSAEGAVGKGATFYFTLG